MAERGITMIDRIQGPPRWEGPDVLLRQTSFRALAEPRRFREPDGSVAAGSLRVRFGEVEARGIALTRSGRALYDELIGEPAEVWTGRFPRTEHQLAVQEKAFFGYEPEESRPGDGRRPPEDLAGLLDGGWVSAHPIVYEDFLPASAAGIFQSNLTDEGTRDTTVTGAHYDQQRLACVLERTVHDPFDLYAAQQDSSLRQARRALGLSKDTS